MLLCRSHLLFVTCSGAMRGPSRHIVGVGWGVCSWKRWGSFRSVRHLRDRRGDARRTRTGDGDWASPPLVDIGRTSRLSVADVVNWGHTRQCLDLKYICFLYWKQKRKKKKAVILAAGEQSRIKALRVRKTAGVTPPVPSRPNPRTRPGAVAGSPLLAEQQRRWGPVRPPPQALPSAWGGPTG